MWDAHTPLRIKASAADTCWTSSRVMRRTRTFVSMACMLFTHVLSDAFLQLLQGPRFGRLREERSMDIFERVLADAPDHDFVAFLFPLQDGAWADPELAANLSRNGDLALRCDFR